MTDMYKFDIPRHTKSIIKVIGVGGGGSNAVNHMFNQGIKDVEFVICNTDSQALKMSAVPNRLHLGVNLTQGLGAGANPEVGKNAAIETREEIRDLLGDDTKMVFITAGMGGGTGTGAAPVIAKIAKEMDILTVGIVTAPFSFEGKKKMNQAQQGIEELRACCDTVLVILNDKLREIYGNLTINNAFAQADNILTTAAKGIAEIITVAGYVNVDFQDVRTVMKNAGAAVMGSAETSGENRARRAAEEALSSPLLDNKDIMGAKNILLSIISGDKAELQMDELSEITEYIQEQSGDHAEVIFGHGVDPELEDRIRVTVIATGFDGYKADKSQESTFTENKPVTQEEPTIFELEKPNQYRLFEMDNSVNNRSMDEIRLTVNKDPEPESRGPVRDQEDNSTSSLPQVPTGWDIEHDPYAHIHDEGDDLLFKREDDFLFEEDDEEEVKEERPVTGRMETREEIDTRERLQRQANERQEKLKNARMQEMDAREFKEKLDVPAYLRRSVKLDNVPHSSENNISKYKLNDENQILGNNRFLYDNVD